MSKAFFMSMFVLVLLGFLISTTINMYNEMVQIEAEYSKVTNELSQLRSNHETTLGERDALKAENTELETQLNQIQQAYTSEKQARLKAEADTAIYKGMLVDMMSKTPTSETSPISCTSTEVQAINSEEILHAGIIPVGAGSIAGLLVSFAVSIMINSRRYKKQAVLIK